MDEWYLFIVAIGLLIMAMSPLFSSKIIFLFIGLVTVIIGGILYQKQKKG